MRTERSGESGPEPLSGSWKGNAAPHIHRSEGPEDVKTGCMDPRKDLDPLSQTLEQH